jgi:hypothetical protein
MLVLTGGVQGFLELGKAPDIRGVGIGVNALIRGIHAVYTGMRLEICAIGTALTYVVSSRTTFFHGINMCCAAACR